MEEKRYHVVVSPKKAEKIKRFLKRTKVSFQEEISETWNLNPKTKLIFSLNGDQINHFTIFKKNKTTPIRDEV